MADAPKRGLRIGHGLFRLWLVLSVLWMFGVGTVYWPQAREFHWPPSASLLRALITKYEDATVDSIPVYRPKGQEGIRWDTLTDAQQRAAQYFVWTDQPQSTTKPKAPLGTPDHWAERLREAEKWDKASNPEAYQFKLVRLTELPLAEAQGFRRGWTEQSWLRFCEDFRGLVAIALGIPLALGLLGFLALRTGRWVWLGFARAR